MIATFPLPIRLSPDELAPPLLMPGDAIRVVIGPCAYSGVVEAVLDDGRIEVYYADASYDLQVWRVVSAEAVEPTA